MQLEDCYYLGTITKKHGYKGELIIRMDTDQPELYKNLESILLESQGLLVPFFLSKCELYNTNTLRIRLEGEEKVDAFIGRDIYLPLSTLPPLSGNQFYYHEIIGFTVKDTNLGLIGTISDVRESASSQDLLEIDSDGKEVLIPIVDEWLLEVNREEKHLLFNTPEGLIDLF